MPRGTKNKSVNHKKVIQERSRLMILTKLASSPVKKMSFTDLKETLGFTAGNLSVHLKYLEKVGYVSIEKRFEGNKPLTTICLTDDGYRALEEYLKEMEHIIKSLKESGGFYE